MADSEQKAMHFLAEGEKKMSASRGFFNSVFGGSAGKADEAVECFIRAGNLFKIAKKWEQGGVAFFKAAALLYRSGRRHEAATYYVDSAICFKKCNPHECVDTLLKAIEIYIDMGKFSLAAKYHQNIAEIYETEALDLEKCIQHYEQAADYFKGEESNSSANKCLLKVAHYSAQQQGYEKAIKIYEDVASTSLENSLLKYSAKEYLFRAALCHMCVDVVNAQHAMERYCQMYPAFQDSREFKLLKVLVQHMEEQNVDAFTEAVKDYDSISRLDQWYTTILLRIKKQVDDNPDLR